MLLSEEPSRGRSVNNRMKSNADQQTVLRPIQSDFLSASEGIQHGIQ